MCISDRHKSFKLRLPSIRREVRRNSRSSRLDPENPPETEESVPLHTLHPSLAATTPTNQLAPVPMEKRLLDRELSDVSSVSHREHGSQGSLRRASSLEHVISDHTSNGRGRLKSTGSGKRFAVLFILTFKNVQLQKNCTFVNFNNLLHHEI